MEELKQQKIEARLKTAAVVAPQGAASSVGVEVNRKRKLGGSSSLLHGAEGDDGDDDRTEGQTSLSSNKRSSNGSVLSSGAIDLRQFMPSGGSASVRSGVGGANPQPSSVMKWGAGSIEAIKAAYSAKRSSGPDGGRTIAESIAEISVDDLFEKVLEFQLHTLCVEEGHSANGAGDQNQTAAVDQLQSVPIRFLHEDQYLSTFRPLMVEEVRAAIGAHLLGVAEGGGAARNRAQQSFSSSNGEFKIVVARCLFRASRQGNKALEEAQVTVVRDESKTGASGGRGGGSWAHDLSKEDLVMVMKHSVPAGLTRFRDLIKLDYSLAVVCSAAKKRGESSTAGGGSKLAQQTLLVLHGHHNLPLKDELWQCVPVMGLSTFIREWLALKSITSHKLMPLAPYLLKGSPVVSSTFLRLALAWFYLI
jgi:hypothetical protein